MKFYLFITVCLTAASITACNGGGDEKQQEKQQQDTILKMHDAMMDKDELLLTNKNKLDTLLKKYPTDTAKTHQISTLIKQVEQADDAMQTWMHQFNPDYTGKTHVQIMEYLKSQQRQIIAVDSLLNAATDASTKFLPAVK